MDFFLFSVIKRADLSISMINCSNSSNLSKQTSSEWILIFRSYWVSMEYLETKEGVSNSILFFVIELLIATFPTLLFFIKEHVVSFTFQSINLMIGDAILFLFSCVGKLKNCDNDVKSSSKKKDTARQFFCYWRCMSF